MTIIVTYLLVFMAGPLLYWALVRQDPDAGHFARLAALVIALIGVAYLVPLGAGEAWQTWEYFGVVILLVLWLAWIAVAAMCVLAVRRRIDKGPALRGAVALGAIATTLPWFGLHLAQMVAQ